ncbi:hypothetical protein Q9R19_03620 [Microbacterium sp. ARD32]|uniref:hypothetical protein n=1 Tax=Microbacterium sp. ARD32 TaxID=2962577 RepID=UPI0028813ADE|nr:hypothetical protein [Microbacterium sp. ARD32]MDT0156710.1 hypothetical protein [Microbacterium sp. ARD32]
MMAVGFAGLHLLLTLTIALVGIGVVGVALYFVVRLAVQHALKAHTRWVDQGKL